MKVHNLDIRRSFHIDILVKAFLEDYYGVFQWRLKVAIFFFKLGANILRTNMEIDVRYD